MEKISEKLLAIGIIIMLLFGLVLIQSYVHETNFILKSSQEAVQENINIQKENRIKSLETQLEILSISNQKLDELVKTNQIINEYRDSELQNKYIEIGEKPLYQYLKNITVYVKGEIPEKVKEDGKIRVKQAWVGTGSILKIENGYTYILTNNHVTGYEEADFSEVILTVEENKYTYYADKIVNNPKYDVAIVRVKGVIPEKEAIKGFSEAYQIQDKVYSVGHYLAIPYLYSEGTIAGYNQDKEQKLLLVNLNVAGGCSGSAVVNKKGELVSVLFATYYVSMFATDNARALTVPYLEFKDWLQENLK